MTPFMRTLFKALGIVIRIVSVLVFIAGLILIFLGGYEFFQVFKDVDPDKRFVTQIAIGLIKCVDLFLVAIVLFVFSFGILMLFNTRVDALPSNLPGWLKIKDFMQLKVILWEAILTTLVISFLAHLTELKMHGLQLGVKDLIIPGGVLLLALSLFFLKKGESHDH